MVTTCMFFCMINKCYCVELSSNVMIMNYVGTRIWLMLGPLCDNGMYDDFECQRTAVSSVLYSNMFYLTCTFRHILAAICIKPINNMRRGS